jgi:quinol monooxygenase YgiN
MGVIRVFGQLICATEQEAARVRAHLGEHLRLTRAEPGCLSFEVSQGADPLVWQVDESYADRAAFEAHRARMADTAWANASAGIRREYKITENGVTSAL